MRIYEELYILRPDTSEEVIEASVDLIRQIVTGAGGVIDKVDKWGLRKLAYRVAKQSEGFYVLVQFSCGPEVVKEIERRLRVNDAVFKYITVRIDEKLKLIEKKKKLREKRAARKPPPAQPSAAPTPAAPAPGLPSAPMPAAPMPAAPIPAAPAPAAPAPAAPAATAPAAEAEPAPATPEPAEK